VMRRAARLQPDQAARQLAEKPHHLRTLQLPAHHHRPTPVNPVHLKNPLGNVQPDRRNLFHGWSPLLVLHSPTWHIDAVRGPSTPSSPATGWILAIGPDLCDAIGWPATRAPSPATCGRTA